MFLHNRGVNEMLTRKFFEVWDASTYQEDEQPPDYVLPYKELFLWLAIIGNLVVSAAVAVLFAWVVSLVDGSDLAEQFQTVVTVTYIVFVIFMIWWIPAVTFAFYWDWRNRPYIVSSKDGVLHIKQQLGKDKWWLTPFVASSGDELYDLAGDGYSTPERSWLLKLLLPYDIIMLSTNRMMGGNLRLVDKVIRRYRMKSDGTLYIHYVQNFEHITTIVKYVNRIPKASLRVQTEKLTDVAQTLEDIKIALQGGDASGEVLKAIQGNQETLNEIADLLRVLVTAFSQGQLPVSGFRQADMDEPTVRRGGSADYVDPDAPTVRQQYPNRSEG